jgi:hypothetical protein
MVILTLIFSSKAQRNKLKEQWLTLGEEEKEPYEKKTRDTLAKQAGTYERVHNGCPAQATRWQLFTLVRKFSEGITN